jgi:Gpi18-like mannosyltransferase
VKRSCNTLLTAALFLLSLIAGINIIHITSGLPGVTPDSVSYLSAAKNFFEGKGLLSYSGGAFHPFAHFPPLYPLVLSLAGFFALDPLKWGLYVNLFALIASALIAALMLRRLGADRRTVAYTAVLILFAPPMLFVHTMIWSEALFILFVVLSLFLLAEERICLSCLFAALALLTRYLGIALVFSNIIVILLNAKITDKKAGVKCALLYGFFAVIPLAVWKFIEFSPDNRAVAFYPVNLHSLLFGLQTISSWFLPEDLFGSVNSNGLYLLFAVLLLLAAFYRSFEDQMRIYAFFCLSFIAALLISICFFDAEVTLDSRILAPIYIPMVSLIVPRLFKNCSNKHSLVRISCAAVLSLAGLVVIANSALPNMRLWQKRLWYTSDEWRSSDLIKAAEVLPKETTIFTNADDAIFVLTGRYALQLPAKIDPASHREKPDYPENIEKVREQLKSGNALLLYSRRVTWRWYLPSEEDLKKTLPLMLVKEIGDGAIYK